MKFDNHAQTSLVTLHWSALRYILMLISLPKPPQRHCTAPAWQCSITPHPHKMRVLQTRLTAREQRVASREQTIQHVDAESASQVAEALAAAAAAYSHARRDLQHEFTAQQEALVRERQLLEADRCMLSPPYTCCSLTTMCLQQCCSCTAVCPQQCCSLCIGWLLQYKQPWQYLLMGMSLCKVLKHCACSEPSVQQLI